MNINKRPIVERIAALIGKTGYRDIRDGFGGSGSLRGLTDQDVAAALGIVKTQCGDAVVQALETFYGSTLMHEMDLCRIWDSRNKGASYEATVVSRMACTIAVRRFAGSIFEGIETARYAWLIKVRRETLERATVDAEDWLEQLAEDGRKALRNAIRETWSPPSRDREQPAESTELA